MRRLKLRTLTELPKDTGKSQESHDSDLGGLSPDTHAPIMSHHLPLGPGKFPQTFGRHLQLDPPFG